MYYSSFLKICSDYQNLSTVFEKQKKLNVFLLNISSFLFSLRNADFIVPVEIDGTVHQVYVFKRPFGTVHQVYVFKRPFVDEFLKKINSMFMNNYALRMNVC